MKKTVLRVGLLLLLSIALAFGMEALQILTQPKAWEAEPRIVREAGDLDFSQCELTGCELKDDSLLVREPGAVVTADFGEKKDVINPQIWSKKVLKEDVPVTIYWTEDEGDFTEERSVSVTLENGGKGWTVEMPQGAYRKLRFVVNGRIAISGIRYAEALEERVPVSEGLRLWRVGLLIPMLFAVMLFLNAVHAGKRLAGVAKRAWAGLTGNGRRTLIHALLFLAGGAAGYFAARLWGMPGGLQAEMNAPRQLFCLAVGLSAACLITFRKTLARKPENLFLVFILAAGSLLAYFLPTCTLVGLDDEYHYDQALNFSYLGEERLTAQDELNILQDSYPDGAFAAGKEREDWLARQDEYDRAGVTEISRKALETKNVFEIFPGLGLYLGRVFGLPYHLRYALGRFFSLIAYSVCGFFAVRRLKSGKMVAALCLLIPTAIAQACNYSYDTGLNGFMALGMAYCFGEWQRREEKVTWGHAAIMYGSMAFGALAKAVYFPMLLLPLFLPKAKFADRQTKKPGQMTRGTFLILNLAAVLLVLATFVIPLLFGKAEGDGRGGDGVDVYGQITWILQHPMDYAGILLSAIRDLTSYFSATGVLNLFAYMGSGPYTAWLMLLMLVVAFTNRGESEAGMIRSVWRRWIGLFLMFGTLCLVCTSMYLIYCSVGADWIGGCQPRYLIPLIFPCLMLAAPEVLAWMAWEKGCLPPWAMIPLILVLVVFCLWRVFPDLSVRGKRLFPEKGDGFRKWTKSDAARMLYNGLAMAFGLWVLYSGILDTCILKFAV